MREISIGKKPTWKEETENWDAIEKEFNTDNYIKKSEVEKIKKILSDNKGGEKYTYDELLYMIAEAYDLLTTLLKGDK